MSFLDELSIPPLSGGPGPSFLDDDNSLPNKAIPSFLTPETTPRRPGTSAAFMNMLDNSNGMNRVGSSTGGKDVLLLDKDTHDTGVALSSAEELHFSSTSLRHKEWNLYRSKILGKGSFGCATLYSTVPGSPTNRSTSLQVVVKDINIQTMTCREEEMAALKDEVTALQKAAGHPNAVQLMDYHYDEQGMMAYIITEFCEGGDVGGALERVKQGEYAPPHKQGMLSSTAKVRAFPEEVVASVLIQVVAALHHLHVQERILHRDLKPHNLFLLEDGITVRLGDFGVAALLNSIGEKAKAACGSPFYMAPELCAEKPYDGGADIWSLGVLLYEMMAQARPFNATTAPALSQLVMKGKCVPLWERTLSSGPLPYSRDLMDLVMSMLTVETVARPTLRRILRSRYVRKHLNTVPKTVLSSAFYAKMFEDGEYHAALDHCLYEGSKKELVPFNEEEEDYYEDDFEDEDS